MEKVRELQKALLAVEGCIDSQIVDDRGCKHIVIITSQAVSEIKDYNAPSCGAIDMFAKHFGLKVAVMPFADPMGRGICYDVAVRPSLKI